MKKKANLGMYFAAALLSLAAGVCSYSQTPTATLSGMVRDQSGGAIPEAKVSLKNTATGVTRTTTTDTQGHYDLINLDRGTYLLRCEHAGFKTAEQSGVVLTVGGSSNVDLTMPVGQLSEVVEVKQEVPLIEPAKAEMSRVVTELSIASLPIIGRNFVDFAKLSSGVAPGRENTGGGAFKEPDTGVGSAAAPRLSFGGQTELNTMILVDGVDNIQTFTGLPRATPSQEAVQEFRILNSVFLTEYGRALGGFVNIITKSGTNDYNGSFYYFGMNNALNAQPVLTGPNPALRQNQYGATFGGPLKKDRTFFFGSYEGQRRAESNKFSQVILNNLSAINVAKAFFGLTPEVNDLLRSNDYDGFLVKADHRLTNNNNLFFRYNLLDSTTNGFLGGGGRASPASTTARNNKTFDQSFVASETAVLRSNMVNEARFQWSRRSFDFPSVLKEPDFEVSNLLITGKSTSDVDFYRETRVQASDSLAFILGRHALKVGIDFNDLRNAAQWDLFFPARVIFANLGGPGPTFLNQTPVVFWWPLLSGATTRPALSIPFTQDVPTPLQPLTRTSLNHNAYGFFAQDEWKATPKLTLTYGLRYDFETYPTRFIQRKDLNNFQPRVGLAFASSPRTVVRAGFGIFHDRLVSSVGQELVTAEWGSAGNLPTAQILFPGVSPLPGRFIQPTVRGGVATLQPTGTCPGQTAPQMMTPATLATCIFVSTGQVPSPPMVGGIINPGFRDNLDGGLRTPYAEQASLRISHELGGGVAVSASYLYVHGLRFTAHTGMLNGVQTGTLPSGKPIFGQRRFPELGDFFVNDSGGYSIYHGGTFEVEKRFAHGFSFHSSYSFSKVISNFESVANLADLPEGPERNLERAVSRQSVPHRYTLTFVSQVPPGVPVLRDFRLSSLLSAQSGRRFNVFAGSDANGDGNPLSDRPGNLGRNTLMGPSFASFDLRVAREFQLRERLRADFAFDFFNLFNHTNITDLNTVYGGIDLSVPPNPILGFGTPRDALNPFQLQYGVKLRF